MTSNLTPSQISTSSFWNNVNELRIELQSHQSVTKVLESIKPSSANNNVYSTVQLSREEVMIRIEQVMQTFLHDLSDGKLPKFTLNKRGSDNNTFYKHGHGMEMLDNTSVTEVSLENSASIRKFAVMMTTLATCYKLLQSNTTSTKRDIFYSNVNFFQNQHVVDEAVSDIACMLGVPRHSLNVLASSKGHVAGNLVFKDEEGNYIDCGRNGIQVPSHLEGIHDFYSKAKYVLVIEKEATFRRLVDEKLSEKLGPCILITGKGFPDVNTRMFLRKLWNELQLPIFGLVDADPHGIEIMCIYRYGSRSLSFEAQSLTCPQMKWLGVLPRDVREMNIPTDALIPLSETDRKKSSDLLKRPYIEREPELKAEIEQLLRMQKKAEIECLDAISLSFMTDIYLPHKLRSGAWI